MRQLEKRLLPKEFEMLEHLAEAGWCLTTEVERLSKRESSSTDELAHFYDSVAPELERIIAYLSESEFDGLHESNLFHLMLSMAEVSFSIEKFGGDESQYTGIPADRFVPVHEIPAGGIPIPQSYK